MNLRLDLRLLGALLLLIAGFQLVPIAAAVWFGEPVLPYAASAAAALLVGGSILAGVRTDDRRIRPRDGFLVVGLAWFVASLFGALPYLTTGALGVSGAIFEAASGFTTTGSTVIADIESLPRALLLWRAFTQWLGGMGIILFAIAILPLLGIGGMQLFRAEVSGPVANKVTPRLAETARRLWYIYVGLTAAETVALMLAGLDGYTAVCHALTTVATGGFSTRGESIGAFGSPLVEWIVIVFMLLGGTNFVLHYKFLSGRAGVALRDTELRYFLGFAGGATLLLWVILVTDGRPLGESIRSAAFQAVSILTTTGYVSEDFERWPEIAQVILLVLMLPGGMAGSTSGAVKSLRCLLALRALRASIERLIHPHAVYRVKYGGEPVDDSVLADIWGFLAAYFLIILAATVVVSASGYELRTAISAAFSAVGNIGPGLGQIGAHDHFGHLPGVTQLALAFCMIAGRLELFTLLVLVVPGFWRR